MSNATATGADDNNSLAARCERWLKLHLEEVANQTATSLASTPPSPPAVCPCLEDVTVIQVRTPVSEEGGVFFFFFYTAAHDVALFFFIFGGPTSARLLINGSEL